MGELRDDPALKGSAPPKALLYFFLPAMDEEEDMITRALLLGIAVGFASATLQAGEIARAGDLEMHCAALPSLELTAEAAREHNVEPRPGRGLLTVNLYRKNRAGGMVSVPGQVYAGAIHQSNRLSSIPIREVRRGNEVYYLGEYQLDGPDTLRFLVNANVLGKPLKSEFTRVFNTP